MKHFAALGLLAATALMSAVGCNTNSSPTSPVGISERASSPNLRGANGGDDEGGGGFVDVIDNPYLPLAPGTVFTYQGVNDGQPEVNRVHVTRRNKIILGVSCTVVEDSVFVGGELHEATLDWYAQDEAGTVWYFGEDSKEFENGQVVSTEGSWEAGVGGAVQGIVMQDDPEVGDSYRQEFQRNVAEDRARVLALNAAVTVPYGHFEGCVKTKEWTRLDPGIVEHKFYARGIGFVKSITVVGGSDTSELVGISTE